MTRVKNILATPIVSPHMWKPPPPRDVIFLLTFSNWFKYFPVCVCVPVCKRMRMYTFSVKYIRSKTRSHHYLHRHAWIFTTLPHSKRESTRATQKRNFHAMSNVKRCMCVYSESWQLLSAEGCGDCRYVCMYVCWRFCHCIQLVYKIHTAKIANIFDFIQQSF